MATEHTHTLRFVMTKLFCTALALFLAGCSPESPQNEDRVNAGPSSESAAAGGASSPVELMRAAMADSPDKVLRLLLTWDTAGLRFEPSHKEALDSVYCYIPDEGCLSEEPGWDVSTLVRGYVVESLVSNPDTAAFALKFDRVADLTSDGVESVESSGPDTVAFRRIAGKWRIVGVDSQIGPHLGLTAALQRFAKSAVDSASLSNVMGQRP
jgi:hypothetical protein